MGKNKKRERGQHRQQDVQGSQENARQQMPGTDSRSEKERSEQTVSNPPDAQRKQKIRFGHN